MDSELYVNLRFNKNRNYIGIVKFKYPNQEGEFRGQQNIKENNKSPDGKGQDKNIKIMERIEHRKSPLRNIKYPIQNIIC